MMTLPNEGIVKVWTDLLPALVTAYGPFTVVLFNNNVNPSINDTLSTYTPATFTGSTPIACPLIAGPRVNPNGLVEMDFTPTLFTCTAAPGSPETIYGYYVVGRMTGPVDTLLWSERFDTPVTITNAGDTVYVEPELLVNSEF